MYAEDRKLVSEFVEQLHNGILDLKTLATVLENYVYALQRLDQDKQDKPWERMYE